MLRDTKMNEGDLGPATDELTVVGGHEDECGASRVGLAQQRW